MKVYKQILNILISAIVIIVTAVYTYNHPSCEAMTLSTIPNPVKEVKSIKELEDNLPFKLKIPTYLPSGYKFCSAAIINNEIGQIIYYHKTEEIIYRISTLKSDISGDYTKYDYIEDLSIKDTTITLRGNNDKYYSIVFGDSDYSYSLYLSEGADKETILNIIASLSTTSFYNS